jgi:hypothetical protein
MVALSLRFQTIRQLLCCLLLLGLFATGCDSEPTQQVSILLFASPPPGSDPYEDVGKLVIRVKADGQPDIEAAEDFTYDGTRQISLPDIPFLGDGTPQQIVLEGWSVSDTGEFTANSKLLSIGRTPSFVLTPDDAPVTFHVQMAKINSFVPLTDALDGNIQALSLGRVGHTMTAASGGEILIAGGATPLTDAAPWWGPGGVASYASTVDLMDNETQNLAPAQTSEGVQTGLLVPRMWHTATALETGDIFFAGGWGQSEFSGECPTEEGSPTYASCTVEWYQPGGAFGLLQVPLAKARAGHTATLVDAETPTILFVGGDLDGVGTYELWDPHTGTHGAVDLPDGSTRRYHAAVKAQVADTSDPPLSADVVVIFGGESDAEPLATGLFYFTAQNQMLKNYTQTLPGGARTQLTGTYVPERDRIYFMGGFTDTDHTAASRAIDTYDTAAVNPSTPFVTEKQISIPPNDNDPCLEETFELRHARGGHTTSLLQDSMLVVLGGSDGTSAVSDIEIVHDFETQRCSASLEINRVTQVAGSGCDAPTGCHEATLDPMPFPANGHRTVVLESGNLLMAGGVSTSAADSANPLQNLYLFVPQ